MQTQLEQALDQLKRVVKQEAEALTRNRASVLTKRYHRQMVKDAADRVFEILQERPH